MNGNLAVGGWSSGAEKAREREKERKREREMFCLELQLRIKPPGTGSTYLPESHEVEALFATAPEAASGLMP
jgi:hypothetical protein